MENSQAFGKHPVEKFLDAPLPVAVATELRGTLLAQTTHLLRRRRRLKRIGYVAGLVACYLLGAGSALLGMARVHSEAPVATEANKARAITANPTSVQAPLPPDRDLKIPAFVLERMAQACERNRSTLYRQAGDRYLADGEYESAVHCYSRSLDAGSEKDLAISRDDNWLLTQLKIARQEEKLNAKSAG